MKRNLLILLTSTLLFSSTLTGCGSTNTTVSVNVENKEELNNTVLGKEALIQIGNNLYYDSTTRIVYWWNGSLSYSSRYSTTPSPYYAPNGLPYKYNPETNTFEEIDLSELLNLETEE